jgi:hypothetical protein
MRQELIDADGRMSGQTLQHIFEITVRIVSVKLRGLYEAHDDRGASPRAQRSSKQPAGAPLGNHAVILPISGKKLKFITAGIRFMVDAYACSTASSVLTAASCMLRSNLAL